MSAATAKGYSKALASLADYLSGDDDSLVHPTAELIEDWGITLFFSGLTPNTVKHYIDVVAALHTGAVKDGTLEPADAFKAVKARIKSGAFLGAEKVMTDEQFARMSQLLRSHDKFEKEDAMYIDLFSLCLLSGCKPLGEIAMLKKSDIAAMPELMATIAQRHCDTRRQYVFPLSQSSRVPSRLELFVDAKLMKLFSALGVHVGNSAIDTARSFWAMAAMKCGVSPNEIYAALGARPLGMPERAANVSQADSSEVIRRVGETILHNPLSWYAMKLRLGTSFDEVKARIEKVNEQLRPAELFYPSLEIRKKIAKRKRVTAQPIIPGVVFFKSRLTNIKPLFHAIGNVAWCYKQSEAADGYAAISRSEMEQFQRSIGQFTSDYEVGPIGSISPRPGDTVKVVGGIFNNKVGELLKVVEHPEEGVIYQLLITDDSGIEWRVGVDSRLTEVGD